MDSPDFVMNDLAMVPRRILLASVGSYGDVFPFLALGQLLHQHGHDVTILTSGYFTEMVESAGLKIMPVGTPEQYSEYVSNPDLIYPFKGLRLTQKILTVIMQPMIEYIRDEWQTPNSLVAASPYCMAARIAQEAYKIPLLTINLAPISLGSIVDPPTLTPFMSPERIPKAFRPWLGRTMHWVTDRTIGKSVNQMRRSLGLAPMRRLMRWWHSPQGTISLFPEWFASSGVDWPDNHQFAGFPESGMMKSSKPHLANSPGRNDLENFLNNSSRLLLFYPGSNASHLKRYFEVCSQVCKQLDYKGILVAPVAKDLESVSDSQMLVTSFVPMETTLSRVQATVHHGGIGTIADCLKAGVPQLIRPMFSDQPDNAMRVCKLGVGASIADSKFRSPWVAKVLRSLIEDPAVAAQCQEYQRKTRELHGLAKTASIIETFAHEQLGDRGTGTA
jgi:rhamnosyltransferase subunit B